VCPEAPIEKPRNFVPSASTNMAGNLDAKKTPKIKIFLKKMSG
jgi:hypothetical protein